eukprot:690773-Pleurochrysis_carterae.AAC.6
MRLYRMRLAVLCSWFMALSVLVRSADGAASVGLRFGSFWQGRSEAHDNNSPSRAVKSHALSKRVSKDEKDKAEQDSAAKAPKPNAMEAMGEAMEEASINARMKLKQAIRERVFQLPVGAERVRLPMLPYSPCRLRTVCPSIQTPDPPSILSRSVQLAWACHVPARMDADGCDKSVLRAPSTSASKPDACSAHEHRASRTQSPSCAHMAALRTSLTHACRARTCVEDKPQNAHA